MLYAIYFLISPRASEAFNPCGRLICVDKKHPVAFIELFADDSMVVNGSLAKRREINIILHRDVEEDVRKTRARRWAWTRSR